MSTFLEICLLAVFVVPFVNDRRALRRAASPWLLPQADRPPMPHSRAELATAAAVFAHVAVLAEPGVFRGRRYGNALVVASQEELPEQALVRALSGGAAPARLVTGERARHFCAGATVVTDAGLAAAAGTGASAAAAAARPDQPPSSPEEPDA